jgi:hypothetical protein
MGFDIVNRIEDCKYAIHCFHGLRGTYDAYGAGANLSNSYEVVDTGIEVTRDLFTIFTHSCHNVSYTYACQNSSYLFGCVGLRSKQYCILNKQYTKEEYEALVPKIIEHMNNMPYIDKKERVYRYGEFFPSEISPFAYNQTLAYDHFMLSKDQTIQAGYSWKDPMPQEYKITISGKDLPDTIEEVKDNILEDIIGCTKCKKAFRIIKHELEFLRHERIPLPRYCVDCRHFFRITQRLPSKLFHRQCMKPGCPNEFETTYAPDRPEIVYCESCYNQEII